MIAECGGWSLKPTGPDEGFVAHALGLHAEHAGELSTAENADGAARRKRRGAHVRFGSSKRRKVGIEHGLCLLAAEGVEFFGKYDVCSSKLGDGK